MNVLGQLLIENGLVSAGQVEEALRRQEQLGGRLGTCLLELGAINEVQLDAALASQLGIPAARVEDLRGIPEEIHSLLPANLAISCEAVPFRVRDDQVDVAILEIKNRGLHDELAFVIGKWIHVHIANEIRIFEALQTYYGKDCTPRFRALLERLEREAAGGAQAGTTAIDDLMNVPFPDLAGTAREQGSSDPRGPKLVYPPSPLRRRSVELTPDERASLKTPPEAPPKTSLNTEAEIASPAPPSEPEKPRPTREAAETVELRPPANVEPHPSSPWKADSAEQIGQSLLRELGRGFRRVVLYRVGRKGVQAWMGKGEGFDGARFGTYRTALAQGSVFDTLASGGNLYVGRLTRSAAHDELLAAIGATPDTECVLSAVTVKGRVVALALCDRGGEGLEGADLAGVQQLTTRAGEAMRELILRRKRKQA